MDIQICVKPITRSGSKQKSSCDKVKSSVPQGMVLTPLLFLILIADIDNNTNECLFFLL